jgi:multidrug efflux system outer membrane protein
VDLFHSPELTKLMSQMECDSLQFRSIAADWEADHWKRFQYAVGGSKAEVEMAEQMCQLRLTLHSQLAQSYFSLRFLDEEKRILNEALNTRETNLHLATERFAGGLTSELDVENARAEVASTRADLSRMTLPRARLENAIGILIGADPAGFSIDSRPVDFRLPTLRTAVPLCILENRPDVAADIFRLKLANYPIGLDNKLYFPPGNLIENNGIHCTIGKTNFQDWSCRTFATCPNNSPPTIKGKRSRPKPDSLKTAQRKALTDYQKTMLEAFQEVANVLAEITSICSEKEAQTLAIRAAGNSAELIRKQYNEGVVSFTELANAERGQLGAERRLIQIRSQQFVATVKLIEALGGGTAKDFF